MVGFFCCCFYRASRDKKERPEQDYIIVSRVFLYNRSIDRRSIKEKRKRKKQQSRLIFGAPADDHWKTTAMASSAVVHFSSSSFSIEDMP